MSQRPKALAQRRAALVARGEARRTEVAAAVMAMPGLPTASMASVE